MNKLIATHALLGLFLGLSACQGEGPATSETSVAKTQSVRTAPPVPEQGKGRFDAATVAHGARLYQAHCAVCHGLKAEGAPNWQRKGPDGKMPPPPLDSTGHAWHHSSVWLRDMIKQGSIRRGGNMPAWEGKLTDADVEAVIAWIQSRWPDEIYQNWLVLDEKARKGNSAHKH